MGPFVLILVSLPVLIISYFVYSSLWQSKYFSTRKVFYLGNGFTNGLLSLLWKKTSIVDFLNRQYRKMRDADAKIGGNVDMGIVTYMVIDADMLRNILVKDFDHFVNRRALLPENDLLMMRMLGFTSDEKWKQLRSKLSPTFTTGKIKRLFTLFNSSSKKLVKFVDERMQESTEGEIDLQESYSKFTMDVIATAVCGYDSQAFSSVEPSTFEIIGKKAQFNFTPLKFLQFILLTKVPKLASVLGLSVFGHDVKEFFDAAIKSSIKERKEKGEKRNDFIQLMLDAREGKLKLDESELNAFEKDAQIKPKESAEGMNEELLDDDGIVSNCLFFMVAGFDTTQSLLIFCAYALALHSEIQEKLRQEIETALDANDGEFTYESVNGMVYLDMVINETLRIYPPSSVVDRGCTKDYKLPGTDLIIKKGDGVGVPIIAIHHDERYYPEPEKFDPERFSPENKSKINPYNFLPFGQGPRNCIGMRFALTEVKLAIARLVYNFFIEPSKRTPMRLVYQNTGSLKCKEDMYLALKRRPGTVEE